jgi:hypothetical protein
MCYLGGIEKSDDFTDYIYKALQKIMNYLFEKLDK